MPPRYVYWTILIDQKPTAFRAKDQADLLPTLNQLSRTNKDVVMKWFARGKLWDSPEAERAAQRKPKVIEKRGREWRPGGAHKDPRARFDKRERSDRHSPPRGDAMPAGVGRVFRPAKPEGVRRDVAQVFRPAKPEGGRRDFRPAKPPGVGRVFRPAGQDSRRPPDRPRPPHPRRDRRK